MPLKKLEKNIPGIHKMISAEALKDISPVWHDDINKLYPWLPEGAGLAVSSFDNGTVDDIVIAMRSSSALDLAFLMAREGRLSEWGSVISISQWAGRGRFHRSWSSPEGGLYAALILPQLTDEWERLAPLMTGYILSESLAEQGWGTLLKWPNDILVGKKKCGGVLIEKKNNFFLAGVGLNLNRKPDEIIKKNSGFFSPGYLSGKDEEPVSAFSLWKFLVKNFKKKYYEIVENMNSEGFSEKIVNQFAFNGRNISLKLSSGKICRGLMTGIDNRGALKVVIDGEEETFLNAEILPGP